MKIKSTIKDQNGGAIIEFAIVLPLLVLLAFGIIEFGILLYDQAVITNASREGARAGIARGADATDITTPAGVKGIVDTYCTDRLITFGAGGTPTTSFPDGDDNMTKAAGADFSVQVTYDYTLLVSQLFGLGPSKTLTAQTVMLME